MKTALSVKQNLKKNNLKILLNGNLINYNIKNNVNKFTIFLKVSK